jgi:hypothetical protein
MPTFDGGHYFLTVLVPILTGTVKDETTVTSPVHALRKQLAMLPTAAQTPACGGGQSPFARNTRNHFARFVIIDDTYYNGSVQSNVIWTALRKINPIVAQPQDHLTCPFLFFGVDFDAASGDDAERDSYLVDLWNTMQKELKDIFTYCVDFDSSVTDAVSFARYIARCQIETTMSFNDYYVDNPLPLLPVWPAEKNLIPAGAGAVLLLLGIFIFCFLSGMSGFIVTLLGLATLAAGLWLAQASILAAGSKPFPTAPDSNLPAVLKALYLQRTFTCFAIENQLRAVDSASADELHAAFGKFIEANEPGNLGRPTQPPGIIGI